MILVDTTVWSRHFRRQDEQLSSLLQNGVIVTHPWIVGELALGPGLRLDILDDMAQLPMLAVVKDQEMLSFVQLHEIRGIGWVDLQLLVAALLARVQIWTEDKRLLKVAESFKIIATSL